MRFVFMLILGSIFTRTSQKPKELHENDICYNDGVQGVCTRLNNCNRDAAAIKTGKQAICSSTGDTQVVCCPSEALVQTTEAISVPPGETLSNTSVRPDELIDRRLINQSSVINQSQLSSSKPPPTSSSINAAILKAKQKCAEYAESVILEVDSPVLSVSPAGKDVIDLCARGESRDVGGQYPHMALIGYKEDNRTRWLCGGSLISERYVLSAAHCAHSHLQGPARWVMLGELDIGTESDDAFPQIIKIISRIVHPEYKAIRVYNDIILFKLERDVKFNVFIRPICLSTTDDTPWKSAIATGWGKTTLFGESSTTLLKVTLNLVSPEKCYETYESKISHMMPQGILKESMICAGDKPGQDTCQGDSGGPLQIAINDPYCMHELIGVTSFGISCGTGNPGIYSRVSHFVPWIVQTVWPE